MKEDNETAKSENEQLKENLLSMEFRLDALEEMYLAILTASPKEKLVKPDKINSDEVLKSVQ